MNNELSINGGDTAWMLVSAVLVLLMTMPGIMLFHSGMLRTRNALSIMGQTIGAIGVVSVAWAAVGYSLAFTPGTELLGGFSRVWAEGLIGSKAAAHPLAPTVPESVFFLYQMALAVIAFAIVLGATAERMRMGTVLVLGAFW